MCLAQIITFCAEGAPLRSDDLLLALTPAENDQQRFLKVNGNDHEHRLLGLCFIQKLKKTVHPKHQEKQETFAGEEKKKMLN